MEFKREISGVHCINTSILKCICFNCQSGLNSGQSFKGHVCNIDGCTQLFTKIKYLHKHWRGHQQKTFACEWANCGQIFDQREQFNMHLGMHAANSCFICTVCNKKFFNRFLLSAHLKTHSIVKDNECSNTCVDANVPNLQYEIQPSKPRKCLLNIKKKFICDWSNCTKSYSKASRLKLHRQMYHESSLPNNLVNSVTPCSGGNCVNNYTHEPTATKHHICDFSGCGKLFSALSELLLHKRIHNGIRPFLCDFENCEKSFRRLDKLNRHRCTHTQEKKCACLECGFKCTRQYHLTKHKLIDNAKQINGNRPRVYSGTNVPINQNPSHVRQFVKCPCSNCYYNKHNPNGVNEHKCDFAGCGISYKDSSLLLIHLRTHVGDRPFSCPFECSHCDAKYVHGNHSTKQPAIHKAINVEYSGYRRTDMKYQVCYETTILPDGGILIRNFAIL